jgi:hypothetical protein
MKDNPIGVAQGSLAFLIKTEIADPRAAGAARERHHQTNRTRRAPLGWSTLEPFTDWDDGKLETELSFKFHRQATNKIGGISDEAAAVVRRLF